MMLIHTAKL